MSKLLYIAGLIAIIALIMFVIVHRKHTVTTAVPKADIGIRYLPLGDSYTIGQSVDDSQRWPNQLIDALAANSVKMTILDNPAVTGYTTQNLIDRELPLVKKLQPDIVTVQIGVNDYVQGVPQAKFEQNFSYILDTLQKELKNPRNIVLITIPDYGKTPTGAQYGSPAASEAAIKSFNAFIMQQGASRHLGVADIFAVSQKVTEEPDLIAGDGLHPSGKQYSAWVNVIYPFVSALAATHDKL